MEEDFRAFPLRGTYLKAAAMQTAAAAVIYWGFSRTMAAPDAAGASALTLIGILALLTVTAGLGLLGKYAGSKEAVAAVLLPVAVAAVGACFGAARASDRGLYLCAGFLLGVGYGVYALIRNVDEGVAPRALLLVTMAQVILIFTLFG